MRIISGIYGGRKLISPPNRDIRPTPDRVKESVFNILRGKIEDTVVIDLFSGTGALGIEALSRGAKFCYFADNNAQSLSITKQNLSFVKSGSYEIIKGDFADVIARLSRRGIKSDIIFCDPPYKLLLGGTILKSINDSGILNDGGSVIIERNTFDKPYDKLTFDLTDMRKYGDTSIDFFQKLRKIAITGTFDPFTNGHKALVEYALGAFDKVFVLMLVNPDKNPVYSVGERLEMIRASLIDYKKEVVIDYFEGLTVDYCAKFGIKYILRGIRSSDEMEYEQKIADYNYTNGGIKTIFMQAKDADISSSLVKEKLQNNKSIENLVDENIISKLKGEREE